MRATQRRRPLARSLLPAIDPERLGRLALVASYVGSVEHKDTPSFAGRPPRPRPDATLCDRALADSRDQLTQWLRIAITKGVIGGP